MHCLYAIMHGCIQSRTEMELPHKLRYPPVSPELQPSPPFQPQSPVNVSSVTQPSILQQLISYTHACIYIIIQISLAAGQLALCVTASVTTQDTNCFLIGSNLNDNKWHSVRVIYKNRSVHEIGQIWRFIIYTILQ